MALLKLNRVPIDYKTLFQKYNVDGPICHVGSLINKEGKTNEDVKRFRDQFKWMKNSEFVGVDIFEGMNVDIVADLCDQSLFVKHKSLYEKFGFVLCRALLEHVKNPFDAARNISSMINLNGHILYMGPWVWGYHPYPDDYWRISFSGLQVLFPDFNWIFKFYHSTDSEKFGYEISDQKLERKYFVEILEEQKISGENKITDRFLPYLNICALGVKKI